MQPTMSKGDFARHINVTPGRVSQYIAAGTIGPDALDGVGRSAKIRVAAAIEQIRQRRDIGQALGNGLSTRLDLDETDEAADAGDLFPAGVGRPADDRSTRPTTVDDEIKQERLQSERRRNRVAAQEEAVRLGQLVEAAKVKAAVAKEMVAQREAFLAMLADCATEIHSKYGVPQRDCLHLLRKVVTDGMGKFAERQRRLAAGLPETADAIVEDTAA
jgi:hypothetical protein